MLYVLFGTDTAKSRSTLASLISRLLSKKPDAMMLRSDSGSFGEEVIRENIESQGLFAQNSIIVLDQVFENAANQTIVSKYLKEMQTSNNIFIILEGKLDAKTKTKLTKHSEKIQECALPGKAKKSNDFNIFELSDALGSKNRKRLWVIYQEGKMHNISSEEMHGILFWGAKNILLAKETKTAEEAGQSSFVYQKSKRYAATFSEGELQNLIKELVLVYHNARRGKFPFDIGFERFILDLK